MSEGEVDRYLCVTVDWGGSWVSQGAVRCGGGDGVGVAVVLAPVCVCM